MIFYFVSHIHCLVAICRPLMKLLLTYLLTYLLTSKRVAQVCQHPLSFLLTEVYGRQFGNVHQVERRRTILTCGDFFKRYTEKCSCWMYRYWMLLSADVTGQIIDKL